MWLSPGDMVTWRTSGPGRRGQVYAVLSVDVDNPRYNYVRECDFVAVRLYDSDACRTLTVDVPVDVRKLINIQRVDL